MRLPIGQNYNRVTYTNGAPTNADPSIRDTLVEWGWVAFGALAVGLAVFLSLGGGEAADRQQQQIIQQYPELGQGGLGLVDPGVLSR